MTTSGEGEFGRLGIFSTSWSRTETGGVRMVVAGLVEGVVFTMELERQEALDNLHGFANAIDCHVIDSLA